MQPPPQRSWINLAELKSQIIRKIGPDRSKQYFDYLNKFLSLKLSKVEFDKLCLRTIGKDGILLHNQLIRSILSNACSTVKAPVENKKVIDGGYHQNGPDSIVTNASSQPVLPNGDILLTSPRKARTGPVNEELGIVKVFSGQTGRRTNLDNRNSLSPDTRRPMQHHQELTQQAQNADNRAKSLHAPLGIPYYPVSIGGARKAPPVKSVSVSDINVLLDTVTLRARMEPISVAQGLQGVSPDSANVLNNGLDVYLKGLIRSCSELNRPRKSNPAHNRPVNGVIPGHQYQTQEHERKHRISLLDFRVAMELNPQQLGEDWPVLLEKIRTPAFEE
ncbi:putative transcriptional coactivator Hfi1/Transcriptional adapter 1 [Helianthus annuus]|nr:putative transcriptional coactivator Hfi1/Transcriptional adapter 1 [Helianthus annuus]